MKELSQFMHQKATRLLDEFCRRSASDHRRPRHLNYRVEGCQIYLYEIRRYRNDPDRHQELPMARIRYTPEINQWTLHHQQEQRWRIYLNVPPSLDFERMLQAIQQDPMGFFWQD